MTCFKARWLFVAACAIGSALAATPANAAWTADAIEIDEEIESVAYGGTGDVNPENGTTVVGYSQFTSVSGIPTDGADMQYYARYKRHYEWNGMGPGYGVIRDFSIQANVSATGFEPGDWANAIAFAWAEPGTTRTLGVSVMNADHDEDSDSLADESIDNLTATGDVYALVRIVALGNSYGLGGSSGYAAATLVFSTP